MTPLEKQLAEALNDALKTAEFEGHAPRPWHHKARLAIEAYRQQQETEQNRIHY
jgi:hypothetical protein